MSNETNSPQRRPVIQDPAQVRRWRMAAGLTLTGAAARLGKSKGYLSQVENGFKGASPAMLALFADAYGCEVIDLLQDPPQRRNAA